MGYCVDIELRNVKFHKDNIDKIKKVLKELNVKWHKSSDWCRYDDSLTDIQDILEDIGFSTEEKHKYIVFEYFEREKLGDHQNMFVQLAPYLTDCEIVYRGEDDSDWKQVIKDGKVEIVERQDI